MLVNPDYMRKNTDMSDDPFSDILTFADARSVVSGGFSAGGAWAIRFPPPDKIKFFALVKGSCLVAVDGEKSPFRMEAGDVFFLSAPRAFVLASDPKVKPIEARSLFSPTVRHASIGEGEDCIQIGGHVRLDPESGAMLSDTLPPLIHVKASSPEAASLRWLIDRLVREMGDGLPGAEIAAAQIAQLLFVHTLRDHLAQSGPLTPGLLRAVSDRRIAPALRLMHGDPGRAWQLDDLAKAAAMSRTTFALHFRTVTGVAPLAYLTEWRMRLAERALRDENLPVATLARRFGYTSESAFSNAFKRVVGTAPKIYRHAARHRYSVRIDAVLPPETAAAL
jgi:AraC-like DNA-binding protein